ncbi:MAG: hypothetical protein RXN84_03505 [Caldivirga sp.]
MELDLRPGEYIVWSGKSPRNWYKILGWVFIAIGIPTIILFLVGFVLIIIGIVLLAMARKYVGGEFLVTNVRAVAFYGGVVSELGLDTPGLTVGLVPKSINLGGENSPGRVTYDIIFTVNGVERLRFTNLTHDSAHELATKLNSMGIKVVSFL